MKVNFLTRLNTWLFVIPVFSILTIYLAIGMWFYMSGAKYVLKDFNSAQLVTMLSDKANALELWGDLRKRTLDEIARSDTLAASVKVIIREQGAKDEKVAPREQGKKSGGDSFEARQRIAKIIEDFGQFKEIFILSADRKIIWSANEESIGQEWADQDVFKKTSTGKPDLVVGQTSQGANSERIMFTSPIMSEGLEIQAVIVAIPSPADLAASLKVGKGFYKTGKVSIIDAAGNVVAATDMTDVGKVRYNIMKGESEQVGYRNGLYYAVNPLRSGQLRLIATLDALEAAKPLRPLTTVYLAFAGLIVLVMLLQVFLAAPKLMEKPLAKLVRVTRSIVEGDTPANLTEGFTGELKILADGFSNMIAALSGSKTIAGRDSRGSEGDYSRVPNSDILSAGMKLRLESVTASLESSGHNKDVDSIAADIKGLLATVVDFNQLCNRRRDSACLAEEEFSVCELLMEVRDACRILINGKEIELFVECPESVASLKVSFDRELLRILCASLLRNSLMNTEVGTITLLPLHLTEGGIECLGLAVSDTGRGFDEQLVRQIMKEGVCTAAHLELFIARASVDLLGGKLEIESTPGNGAIVTVAIPFRERPCCDKDLVKTD